MNKIKKAVIPAAGMGTRLLPLTRSQPKEMLPVGRKPVIQYVIEEAISAGIEYILVITTQSKKMMEDFFTTNESLIGKVYFIHQHICSELPYGLAHAISLSQGFVGNEPFVVCLGDCIIDSEENDFLLKRMIRMYNEINAFTIIAFEEVPIEKVSRYGIAKPLLCKLDKEVEEFQLEDIIEKPPVNKSPSNMAVAARYVFDPNIFSFIKRTQPGIGGELQITDSIRLCLRDGLEVWGSKLRKGEKRYDIGSLNGYFKAFFDFSIKDEEYGEDFGEYVRKVIWKEKRSF